MYCISEFFLTPTIFLKYHSCTFLKNLSDFYLFCILRRCLANESETILSVEDEEILICMVKKVFVSFQNAVAKKLLNFADTTREGMLVRERDG